MTLGFCIIFCATQRFALMLRKCALGLELRCSDTKLRSCHGDPPCQPAHQMKSAVSYSEHDLLIFSSDFCGKKKPNNNKKLDCVFTLRYSSQRRTTFISRPRFKAGEFDSFNRWAFVLDRGCTCVLRLCFHPLIGPAEAPSPSNGPAAAIAAVLWKRTCLETDGAGERVGTARDEPHICRSQGIGPQTVRDYTVE